MSVLLSEAQVEIAYRRGLELRDELEKYGLRVNVSSPAPGVLTVGFDALTHLLLLELVLEHLRDREDELKEEEHIDAQLEIQSALTNRNRPEEIH